MPDELHVARGETELGSWEFAEATPLLDHRLGGAVVRSSAYRERFDDGVSRREVPRGTVQLMLTFGDPLDIAMPDGSQHHVAGFLAGLHDGPAIVHSKGTSAAIQLELTPVATYRLFGIRMAELTNHLVPLDDVLGRAADQLADQMHAAPSWYARVRLAHAFVADRLVSDRPTPAEVVEAYRILTAANGAATVADVAAEVGWSRRHLASVFAEHVGLPPKAVARVARFTSAVGLLDTEPGAALVDVAVGSGYYDQAHFNREFRALAGCTPTEFRRATHPGGVGVLADPW